MERLRNAAPVILKPTCTWREERGRQKMPKKTESYSAHRSQLFILRVWCEPTDGACGEWRGQVRHVLSGEIRYFRHGAALIPLLNAMLAAQPEPSSPLESAQASNQFANPGEIAMTTEANKAIVRQLIEAINTDNEATFLALLRPDVVDHYSLPGLPPGREGWNLNRKMLRAAFPDAYWHEEDLFAEADRVVGRYTLQGTHLGEFLGLPATGKSIRISNIHIVQIANGKIVEHWGHGDDMAMMRQLGALPA